MQKKIKSFINGNCKFSVFVINRRNKYLEVVFMIASKYIHLFQFVVIFWSFLKKRKSCNLNIPRCKIM